MAITLTVSELKCACLDKNWRDKWRAGEKPSTRHFSTSANQKTVYGTKFHKLVELYTDWLLRVPAAARLDCVQLWHECYVRFAETELTRLAVQGKVEPALHLARCLREFCAQLAQLRDEMPTFRHWPDIFITQEYTLNAVPINLGMQQIFISGRLDAVRRHPERGLEIVEYKLAPSTKHDFLQLAIYAKLLEIAKLGLTVCGTLEYYTPVLHRVAISSRELTLLFEDKVMPVLREMSGMAEPSSGESAKAANPCYASPPPADLSQAIIQCYADFNLGVEVLSCQAGPQLVRYKLKPTAGVKVVSLANRAEDLQVALNLAQTPLIEPAQGCVTIDIPKAQAEIVDWGVVMQDSAYLAHPSPVAFPLGVGVDNQVIIADFSDPNTAHALVAGSSGMGKSALLKSLVAALMSRNSPDSLKLSLIDPKLVTFNTLTNSPYLAQPMLTEVAETIACLEQAALDMEARYRLFNQAGVENLSEMWRKKQQYLPFHVIVFDEFNDLLTAGKEYKKDFETLVTRIAQKGRAAGIHLVLATQRPDRHVINGLIKANLPMKICLRVTSAVNSQIILDQPGAQALIGRGDVLCDLGKGIERAQTPLISQKELLRAARVLSV